MFIYPSIDLYFYLSIQLFVYSCTDLSLYLTNFLAICSADYLSSLLVFIFLSSHLSIPVCRWMWGWNVRPDFSKFKPHIALVEFLANSFQCRAARGGLNSLICKKATGFCVLNGLHKTTNYLSFHSSIYLFIYPSIKLPNHPFIHLAVWLSLLLM